MSEGTAGLDAGNPDIECPECGEPVTHYGCDGENAYLAPCGHRVAMASIHIQQVNHD